MAPAGLQSFWHITLPMLRWPLMVALFLRATDVWKMFDYVAA